MIINLPKKKTKTLDFGSVIVGKYSSYLVVQSMCQDSGATVTLIDLKNNVVWDEFADLESVMYEFSQVEHKIYNSTELALGVARKCLS